MKEQTQYILVGYPFAGKSFLAKEICRQLDFTRLSIDEVKFELGYKDISDDKVPKEAWDKIFNTLDERIIKTLKEGKTIINEYAWLTREWRDRARKLAKDLGIQTTLIFVDTPESIVRQRWQENRITKERFDVSDSVFEEAIRLFEPPENETQIVFNMQDNIDEWIKNNLN